MFVDNTFGHMIGVENVDVEVIGRKVSMWYDYIRKMEAGRIRKPAEEAQEQMDR